MWRYEKAGPPAFVSTFNRVAQFWINEAVNIEKLFGSNEDVAAFAAMTLRSNTTDNPLTTPFAMWCVVKGERIVYLQFMEDTFGTALNFRVGESWRLKLDPATRTEFTILYWKHGTFIL